MYKWLSANKLRLNPDKKKSFWFKVARRSIPENMFLKVSFYSSYVHKSKVHFNMSFSYDAPNGIICHWKFKLLQHYHVSKRDLKPVSEVVSSLVFLATEHRFTLVTTLLWFTTYDLCNMIWIVCLRIREFGD